MAHEQVSIHTKDGACPTHVFTPDGKGPWPAVIFYMDALAMRPAIIEMATRLSNGGYVVLLPDLFYRFGHYDALKPKEAFASGDLYAIIGPMMKTTSNRKAAEDTEAFIAYLDTRSDVAGKIGTVGFCMGGGMALTVAGKFPDRVGAAISFHGGNLVTDTEESPSLFVAEAKAEIYVAGADHDKSYPPEMAEKLEEILTDAGVVHRCEIYKDASHGWMKPDFPIYDEAAAERGWKEMFALFGRALK
jgi:carboxymethylenebutenolidase